MSVNERRERTDSIGEWWVRVLGGLIKVGCLDIARHGRAIAVVTATR